VIFVSAMAESKRSTAGEKAPRRTFLRQQKSKKRTTLSGRSFFD
jgi:hypothetical protein